MEAIDLVVHCIKDRFEQPRYAVYRNLEQFLLKASDMADTNSEFDCVCSFYKDDLQPEVLQTQLPTFGLQFQQFHRDKHGDQKSTIFDIKEYFSSLITLLSEVGQVMKLILIMHSANATSERSFSYVESRPTFVAQWVRAKTKQPHDIACAQGCP